MVNMQNCCKYWGWVPGKSIASNSAKPPACHNQAPANVSTMGTRTNGQLRRSRRAASNTVSITSAAPKQIGSMTSNMTVQALPRKNLHIRVQQTHNLRPLLPKNVEGRRVVRKFNNQPALARACLAGINHRRCAGKLPHLSPDYF